MCYHLHSDVLFMKKLIDITKEKGDFEKKLWRWMKIMKTLVTVDSCNVPEETGDCLVII